LGVEGGAAPADLIQAARFVEKERAATDFASTQEQSWMVLAAEALAQQGENLSLSIDGAPHKGVLYRNFRSDALAEKPVVIANGGAAPTQVVVTVSGHPKIPEPEAQHGYKIERSFFKLDGTPVPLDAIRQNDRLVVALKVTELEAAYARLILVDRLPAGLEIDNPNLFDGGSVESLAWVKPEVEPSHTEYRDDRFVAAFDRNGQDKATFSAAYVVRAVSPGKYVLPPATIEDMYRPERFGRTAYGAIEIRESAGR